MSEKRCSTTGLVEIIMRPVYKLGVKLEEEFPAQRSLGAATGLWRGELSRLCIDAT